MPFNNDLDFILILNLLSSFIIGGLWISGIAYTIERLGPRLGGYLSGLPSTSFITLVFIAITQDKIVLYDITNTLPLTMAVISSFLLTYKCLSKRIKSLTIVLILSIGIWSFFQSILIIYNFNNFYLSIILWFISVVFIYRTYIKDIELKKYIHFNKVKKISLRKRVFYRAIFGGLTIAIAVLSSNLWGAIFGSVLSSFPAVFLSTIVILHKSHGAEYTRLSIFPMMLSAVINVTVFIIFIRFLSIYINGVSSVIIAYIPTVLVAFIIYKIINRSKTLTPIGNK